jgi:aldehyde dehydrogenase (NAD+)
MNIRNDYFANGKWQPSHGAGSIKVVNPYSEAQAGTVPECDLDDVNTAVASARFALPGWSRTTLAERSQLLQALESGLKQRADELARLITAEMGMPLRMSQRLQVGLPLTTLAKTRELLATYKLEEQIGNSIVVREPIGVVACITPWNYPLHQIMSKVAPALAAGCTIVLKPSEVAPMSAFILAEEIAAAGFPPGVFNLVTGYGRTVGEYLAGHADVDMVSFTGSTLAGKSVSALAAQTVKRVALELGGKSAAVILDDADLATAVKNTVNVCFLNAGQTCNALTRMLVPRARYEEAAALAVAAAGTFSAGDPMDEKTRLGPLTTRAQQERVLSYIRRGMESGAELLTGGVTLPANVTTGYFVAPTIFGKVDPASVIAQEEIFGPVLSIITYETEDEAVAIANGTRYGLAAAVWSASEARAGQVARRLQAGQVDINGGMFNPLAPFGGYKQSGNGRELGRFGLEEFFEVKSMQFKSLPTPA